MYTFNITLWSESQLRVYIPNNNLKVIINGLIFNDNIINDVRVSMRGLALLHYNHHVIIHHEGIGSPTLCLNNNFDIQMLQNASYYFFVLFVDFN